MANRKLVDFSFIKGFPSNSNSFMHFPIGELGEEEEALNLGELVVEKMADKIQIFTKKFGALTLPILVVCNSRLGLIWTSRKPILNFFLQYICWAFFIIGTQVLGNIMCWGMKA